MKNEKERRVIKVNQLVFNLRTVYSQPLFKEIYFKSSYNNLSLFSLLLVNRLEMSSKRLLDETN